VSLSLITQWLALKSPTTDAKVQVSKGATRFKHTCTSSRNSSGAVAVQAQHTQNTIDDYRSPDAKRVKKLHPAVAYYIATCA